jgi:hypothetical protein
MKLIMHSIVAAMLFCAASRPASAAADGTLLRLYLRDGSALVSYGEYARMDDRVIFSMPVGGTAQDPKLYVVSLPAARVDWARTERSAMSSRAQWYATTRGEADFQQMSADVARILNEVAQSPDRRGALSVAERARATLATWPAEHFGYRQNDVREIVQLLDEAISSLRASAGISEFALDLVAAPAASAIALEPLVDMPTGQQQLDQLIRLAALTDRASDRVALLHTALGLIDDPNSGIPRAAADTLRVSITGEIREEAAIDARYASMATRLMEKATRAAEGARIADVERVLNDIPKQDRKLGQRRPQVVQSLRASVQGRLDDARRLRLLKDRWVIRQALYREWQRSAGVQLLRLLKERPALEAIRRLEGPQPDDLADVTRVLAGGAERLERIGIAAPDDLRSVNELLISAWRFADTAATARYSAVADGKVDRAWEASSAAAAALLLLDRVQEEIRILLEPPQLQ